MASREKQALSILINESTAYDRKNNSLSWNDFDFSVRDMDYPRAKEKYNKPKQRMNV